MYCPRCGSRMKILKSFGAGASNRTQKGICTRMSCGRSVTIVSVIAFAEPIRGEGAYSVARKISDGSLRVRVEGAGGGR